MDEHAADRFLEEAVRRELLTAAEAEDCRRLAAALLEVDVELPIEEVAARKGYVSRADAAEVKRALARLRIGRYEVLEKLGEGGTGVVWRARDTKLDRIVALKVLSRGAEDLGRYRQRFLREARVAVTLNHVNIVRGLDHGEADGYHYFAMEYVAGESVAARLRREGRLAEAEALRVALDVVRALEHVQRYELVHRDVKPENLLVTPTGQVKLCDLGLAKPTLEEAARIQGAGVTAGTPLYMSPEQIQAPERVDWRSDVYGLGATLYHMLTGRPPFPMEPGGSVIHRHLTEVPPSPREHVLELSAGAAAIVMKMLQKDPANRYQRLSELASDLESALVGRTPIYTVAVAPRERIYQEPRRVHPVRRRRVRVRAAAAAAGLALVALGFGAWWTQRTSEAARHAQTGERRESAAADAPTSAPGPPIPAGGRAAPKTARQGVPVELAEVAREALAEADREARAHPDDFPGLRSRYEFVVVRYPATAAARLAQERLADLVDRHERFAEEELDARDANVVAARSEGRYGDALRELDGFPPRWADTAAGRRAAERRAELEREGRERVAEAVERARAAAGEFRFDDARAILDETAGMDVPGTQAEIAAARVAVAGARSAWQAERDLLEPAFARLYAQAVLEAGASGHDLALDLVLGERGRLAVYAAELRALRFDLDEIERARRDPSALASRSVADVHARMLLALSRGQVDDARAQLEVLRALGASEGEHAGKIARVRAVLVQEAEKHLRRAEAALAEGRPQEALRRADEAESILPGHPPARVLRARALLARGDADVAERLLEDVLRGADAPVEAHLRLAELLLEAPGGRARAEEHLRTFLATAAADDGRRPEAQQRLAEARRRSNAEELEALRRLVRDARRREPEVESAWARILELAPNDPDALFALGGIYAESARPFPAYRMLRTFVERHAADGRRSRAERRLEELETRWAPTPAGREAAGRGQAALAAGDLEGAEAAFAEALGTAPFLEAALLGLAEARVLGADRTRERARAEAALAAADDVAFRFPGHPRGIAVRAEALLLLGQHERARDEARRALAADPTLFRAAIVAGHAALGLGQEDAALDWFNRAFALDPRPEAMVGRAMVYERQGRLAAARAEVDTLCQRFPVELESSVRLRELFDRLDLELRDGE